MSVFSYISLPQAYISVQGDRGITSHNRHDSKLSLDGVQELELHTQKRTRELS